MKVKLTDGLTAAEIRFCALLAQGFTQADAYRDAYGCKRVKPARVWERASRLRTRPAVAARLKSLLDAAKIQDIDSVARAYADGLADLEAARTAGNWTAAAAFTRLRYQALAMLQDRVSVTGDFGISDDALVERLAKGNADTARVLRGVLGAGDGFGGLGKGAGGNGAVQPSGADLGPVEAESWAGQAGGKPN